MTAPLLAELAARGPLRVGLIGAGKFGTMFLSQARLIDGLDVLGVADLSLERARASLLRAGWPEEENVLLVEDAQELLELDGLDVVVEATGVPEAGVRHALAAFERGRHVVMVNVEADALVGPVLARRAAAAGVVYSLAYGDQPALICELVDWARTCGFEVVCAGKGTKYLPAYHYSTPDTVWEHYGIAPEDAAAEGLNPQMFNSFLDGTKSAIEMAAVANAADLEPQPEGLRFPPCGADRLPEVLRPGGALSPNGTVEVVSSLERDGTPVPQDLRFGVFVVFEAPSEYVRRCFAEYGLVTDASGRYAALYRPFHLIGLELAISVLRVGLRGEATGVPEGFRGDVVATVKRDLEAGQTLDGEGGYCAYGSLLPAEESVRLEALPIGLSSGARLKRPVARGELLRLADVELDAAEPLLELRRELVEGCRNSLKNANHPLS